ncbi:transposase [Bradyrhizobium sp. UFLA05-112]
MATAIVPEPAVFRSVRQFAAWLGLTPKQNSTSERSARPDSETGRFPILGTFLSSKHVTSFGTQRHARESEAAGPKLCVNGLDRWLWLSPLLTIGSSHLGDSDDEAWWRKQPTGISATGKRACGPSAPRTGT